MNAKKHSRQYWKFDWHGKDFDTGDVRKQGDEIWFRNSKHAFQSEDECVDWLNGPEGRKAVFEEGQKVIKNILVTGELIKISDAEWEKMKSFMPAGESLSKDNFVVFDAWLAHNMVDRDAERFELSALKSLQKTIVGKNVLSNHDWGGSKGEARFFSAKVQKVTADEMFELMGPLPNKSAKAQIKQVEEIDGSLNWLVARYYMLNVTEKQKERVLEVMAGIGSGHMSIGFSAPDYQPKYALNGKDILWWEFRNTKDRTLEAMEGSWVFLGAQPGAGTKTVKNQTVQESVIRDDDPESDDALKIPHKEKDVNLIDNKGEVIMIKVNFPAIDFEIEADDGLQKSLEQVNEKLNAKLAEMDESLKAARDERDVAKAEVRDSKELFEAKEAELVSANKKIDEVKGVFGDDYSAESLKQVKAEADGYRKSLIDETIKYGDLTKMISKDDIESEREFLESQSIDRIKVFCERYSAKWEQENPNEKQLPVEDDSKSKGDVKTINPYKK